MPQPTIGRIVIYRSRTNKYSVPAVITATQDTLNPEGVQAGTIPDLSSPEHVHLTVFTPGQPGYRTEAHDFVKESPHGRSENIAGTYQEWDIPYHDGEGPQPAATWAWPTING